VVQRERIELEREEKAMRLKFLQRRVTVEDVWSRALRRSVSREKGLRRVFRRAPHERGVAGG
jgi:hypothetical protein